jgi:type I restriction enzyme S subunit
MGQAPPGDSYNETGDGMPLVAGAGDFAGSIPKVKKFTSAPGKVSEAGDIILGIRASIGERVWSDTPYCLGRGVAGLRPLAEQLDRSYLWHWLGHAADQLKSKGRGATFLQVNQNDIREMEIPLPPLDEQRRIAAILDQADGIRAKRRSALGQIDKLSQSAFLQLFGDPLRNPRRLRMVRLGEVGALDRGVSRHRPRNDPALLGGPYPLIQTGDVARSGGRITEYSATYSELGLAQSKSWPAGTLCITIAANIAQTGVLTFDACFPDSVVGFTADRATTSYIRVWFSFLQPTLEASAPQSAQRNINLAILRGLPVPLPQPEELEEFERLLGRVQQQRELNLDAQGHDEDLFASLQSRAFQGEL